MDEVLSRNAQRDLFEPDYGRVYGSAIFTRSAPLVERFRAEFPSATVGGSGVADWTTVEQMLGVDEYEHHDYSIYPEFEPSLGFTMRGCRLACGFCIVPRKEGAARRNATVADIWRGDPWPRHLVLLDNDFFGQPRDAWLARLAEIRDGGFRVSFNQGINVRLLNNETATELARTPFYDDSFRVRRLYTAFDSQKDERVFRRGIEALLAAGVKGDAVMVYMLVGYAPDETWEAIFARLSVMREYGVRPYPMVYQVVGAARSANALPYRALKDFQRWIIRRHYHVMSFDDYLKAPEGRRRDLHAGSRSLFAESA